MSALDYVYLQGTELFEGDQVALELWDFDFDFAVVGGFLFLALFLAGTGS